MSPYLVLLVFLIMMGIAGFNPKIENLSYKLSFLILTVMLVFRFGQGTDWLSYNYIYSIAPAEIDFHHFFYSDLVHSEVGWKLICNIFKVFDLDFVHLSIACALVEMFALNRFLTENSTNRSLSLVIAYPTVYLTYFFSSMRQGLVIAIFLGMLIGCLRRGKFFRYSLLVLLLSTIHSMALLLLILPFVIRYSVKQMFSVLSVSAAIGICLIPIMPSLMRTIGLSYADSSISIPAVCYRLLSAAIVYFSYTANEDDDSEFDPEHALLLKLYLAGLSVYALAAASDIMASRLASPLLAIEIAIVPTLLKRSSQRLLPSLVCLVIASSAFMTIKNIDSYIKQGYYVSGITVANYPYISLFNKEDIYRYTANPYLVYLDI